MFAPKKKRVFPLKKKENDVADIWKIIAPILSVDIASTRKSTFQKHGTLLKFFLSIGKTCIESGKERERERKRERNRLLTRVTKEYSFSPYLYERSTSIQDYGKSLQLSDSRYVSWCENGSFHYHIESIALATFYDIAL